jgi:hypothetical protein
MTAYFPVLIQAYQWKEIELNKFDEAMQVLSTCDENGNHHI